MTKRRTLLGGVAAMAVLAGQMAVGGSAARAALAPGDLARAFGTERVAGWAEPLADGEMDQMRGGFGGVMFSAFFNGTINGELVGGDNALPEGVAISTSPDFVQISGGLGDFGDASGVFQFANVIGDFNQVTNQMTINVALISDPSAKIADFVPVFSAGLAQ
ncbi:hypothetical protein [Rhodothalassium salexigens]|uniref:hypothetical protein n=1 Tax=Rhodothalassium salexigens TaxID=1086 RepID=UPI00191384D0|nr:hypothetical protein [Rhodothalassium salexigens]